MPYQNRFRHQPYTCDAPGATYELLRPGGFPPPGSDEFARRMAAVGKALRAHRVRAIYLVHGTFAGWDALGLLAELDRYVPALADVCRHGAKRVFDSVAGDVGNYTAAYAETFERAINRAGEPHIHVRRFSWSGENHHIGRADAAVRLLDELLGMSSAHVVASLRDATRVSERLAHVCAHSEFNRVLLWGHSHAGNVFALMTNLLAGNQECVAKFFRAARSFCRRWFLGRRELPHWQRVREALQVRNAECGMRNDRRADASLGHSAFRTPHSALLLDFVTFGTPIRYGWDTGGYGGLLHFINHRPCDGLPPYRAPFPPREPDVRAAAHGDCVQQLGIAGTNFLPTLLSGRALLADWRLGRLLQKGIRRRDLWARLCHGMRVPAEGTTLLVDYGPPGCNVVQHLAGHAVYTRPEWMLLHAEETVRRLYLSADSPHAEATRPDGSG